ncbi:DUF3939 domain-containing protein [Paenibacillus sp. D2_2]|uniref:DUF3939 domain-containing protein n=1 Tax=Paenibacillus sp. D2_2 TaxID=3073092 RepID=UPI002814BE03|nr:DUF3939 domain-containing protein [Paenibacillus sp. D2_2]WMT42680.1 DUF3939 domain-containing protein [Paenibacillus sp. D2_2]
MRRLIHQIVSIRFRPFLVLVMLASLLIVLSGCMYPGDQGQANTRSYRESVDRVQRALDQFQADTGILPIITACPETPRYEKYRINMIQLHDKGYMEEIPNSAFEQGGNVYFLVLNEEIDPTVKVMDLLTVQKVNDVQRLVDSYRSKHDGGLPVQDGPEAYPGLSVVDLKLAGAQNYKVSSVFSGQEQPFLINDAGNVYLDYAFDIMQVIDTSKLDPEADQVEDLRTFLTDHSYYVPVKSLPYIWQNGAPVAVANGV